MDHEPQLERTIPPHRNLALLLEESAARCPEHIAISFNALRWTYAELQARVRGLGQSLTRLGIKQGDRVALVLPNTPTYVLASYALFSLGAVVVNVSPGSQGTELGHILRDSGAVAVISLDVFLPGLYKVLPGTAVRHLFITSVQGLEKKLPPPAQCPAPRLFEELLRPAPDAPRPASAPLAVRADDLAVLQYTSGSTGAPKGVMLSHRSVLASVAQVDGWMSESMPPNAGVLCVIPFFHVFGMTIGLHLGIAKGYRLILVPRFDVLDLMPLIRLIEEERPVSFPAVPTLWAALLTNPALRPEALAGIRVPSSGGAPLPAWVQEKFRALTGRPIYEAYGLSEAAGATHCSPFPDGAPAGSIGRPLAAVRARLVDPETGEREVGEGEVGELLIRSETLMSGYFGAADSALSGKVLRDGWLHTGDLARRDAAGFYYIVDRKDDLILSSGYNVYPSEVEAVLLGHPAVKDAAVVGVPDRLRGQFPLAHVVIKEGASVTSDELLQLCRDNLSPYKVPRRIVFAERVPRNPAGKTLRRELL